MIDYYKDVGVKSFSASIPDCSALCAPTILKDIQNLFYSGCFFMFLADPKVKILLQSSLRQIFGLLILVSYKISGFRRLCNGNGTIIKVMKRERN